MSFANTMNANPHSTKASRWSWAAVTAVIMTLLAIYPVLHLRSLRGKDWNGSFAYLQGDELIYAAYVNSLRTGRPRCNNPYTGEQDRPGARLGESAYSIQIVPAYSIALIARVFRLSTSAAFAVLMIFVALSTSLILFWLILSITGDARLAAAGVLFVLCLGSVPTLWGLLQILRGLPADFSHLRFLRRYAPSAAFPFFFAFCALVWQVVTTSSRRRSYIFSLMAGAVFVILVFSYFYSWTAALAWVICLALLWVLAKPNEWRHNLKLFGVIAVFVVAALLPYAWLLTKRARNQIEVTMLARTHAPDLVRVPQLVSFVLLALLIVLNRKGLFSFREKASLFATSFVVLPFVLFNQQIVTGLSLQPTHYEVFGANYCVLLAVVLIAGILWSNLTGPKKIIFNFGLILIAGLSVAWGTFEVARSTEKFTPAFITRDEATPAARRLAELREDSSNGSAPLVILATDPVVADYLPTIAPQALLWAPHMYGFAGTTPSEDRRRLLSFLYYSGIRFAGMTAQQFEKLDPQRKYYFSSLLGRNRIDRSQSNTWTPVTATEFENAQRAYSDFMSVFDREMASRPILSYVLMSDDQPVDLANLDRWYERDKGERIGKYVLYRVSLRPRLVAREWKSLSVPDSVFFVTPW